MVNVYSVAVRDDRDMDGVGDHIAEEHAVADFQIFEFPAVPIDAIKTPGDAGPRLFEHRQTEKLQTQNRDVAGLNQYAVSGSSAAIRTPVPCGRIRKRHGEYERRHPVGGPSRIVGKEFGADGQPVGRRKRSLLRLQQHRLADGIDALGEEKVIGPVPVLWLTRRPASPSVRSGDPLAPEFPSAPVSGFR